MNNNIAGFPLYTSNISETSQKIISNSVKKYIKNYPQNFKESWNCSTKSTIHIPKSQNISCEVLNNEIIKHTNFYFSKWGFIGKLELSIDTIWINISTPGSYQELHNHKNYAQRNLFSGVLYIDTLPNSGELVLHNPIASLSKSLPPSNILGDQVRVIPENGLIVSFPSFIFHEVYPNKSSTTRISVSWNIKIV